MVDRYTSGDEQRDEIRRMALSPPEDLPTVAEAVERALRDEGETLHPRTIKRVALAAGIAALDRFRADPWAWEWRSMDDPEIEQIKADGRHVLGRLPGYGAGSMFWQRILTPLCRPEDVTAWQEGWRIHGMLIKADEDVQPTHWMPLPPDPVGEQ